MRRTAKITPKIRSLMHAPLDFETTSVSLIRPEGAS